MEYKILADGNDVLFAKNAISIGIKEAVDINEILIKHPSTTFFAKVIEKNNFANLSEGDLLVIDSSFIPSAKQLVFVAKRNEFYICQFHQKDGIGFLLFDNGDVALVENNYSPENQIIGVVTHVIYQKISK